MPLKVTWKKGMRLSSDIFNALDITIEEYARLASLVASGARYGLITTTKPFELSVNVNNNILEVVSLCCRGITKSGKIIDIDFDSNYTSTFDTRVTIPTANNGDAFLLVVKMRDKEWREVSEVYSEPAYSFELLGENNIIDNDSLPIGCVVNQYGWRLDETTFVPPCLFVSSHPKYVELLERTKIQFKSIRDMCLDANNCVARILLSSIWNAVSNEFIELDKLHVALTPSQLYASIQKVVSAFVRGCFVDQYISLENADPFVAYINKPYNARMICHDIEQGLGLCAEIYVKMGAVCEMTEVQQTPPTVNHTPKTEQLPQPQVKGRNRWEGIEI